MINKEDYRGLMVVALVALVAICSIVFLIFAGKNVKTNDSVVTGNAILEQNSEVGTPDETPGGGVTCRAIVFGSMCGYTGCMPSGNSCTPIHCSESCDVCQCRWDVTLIGAPSLN